MLVLFINSSYNLQSPFILLILNFTIRILEQLAVRMDFPGGASGKEPTCQCRRHETHVQSLGQEDPLEEEMATQFSILAWRIPWTEESGRLQSIGSQRVRYE